MERQCHKGDDENKEREILKMLGEEVDVDSDDDEDYTAAGDEEKESYINQVNVSSVLRFHLYKIH